jgi:hypothetical protein
MKTLGITLFLAAVLAPGDVLVLKGGGRVSGRVVEKAEHYEVTSEGVLRTYLKDEVEKVVSSPREFLGNADKLFEEARTDYQKALGISETSAKNAVLKEAIGKVARARESYSAALDLFPDDGNLGKQIMLLMQLMRLLRERVSHDDIGGPLVNGSSTGARPTPVVTLQPDDALSTLLDPAKRTDPGRRAAAVAAFRSQKTDLAYAAIMFLSKSDAEMKLDGPALKAVQDYFEKPWLKEPQKLTPVLHLQAAQHLAGVRGSNAAAADALLPFAVAHCSGAAGPDLEKTARSLGLVVQNGLVGTPEGHAVRDLNTWISNGEFDLAVMAFVNEYRSVDTPAVRYVWSYALLRLVQAKKKNFERPISAFETVKAAGAQDHLAAMVKSIRAVATCNACSGAVKLRCTNCHGKKETRFVCAKCKGKGHTVNTLGAQISCVPCRATGISGILKCEKCKDGYFDCKQCDKKQRTPPDLADICDGTPCAACEGRGLAFRNAAIPCRSCLGLGQKLAPKLDPGKILP